MKNHIKLFFSFLLVFFMTKIAFAQTENYKTIISSFQKSYNTYKYDEIFNSFSPEMKQALPIDNIKQFLSSLKTDVGKIEVAEFKRYEKETYAVYKTTFEKGVLAVNISLNHNNQIDGFFIAPYEDHVTEKITVTNALSTYPVQVAGILYEQSKDFPNNTQLSVALIENGVTNYYGILKENDSIKPILNHTSVFEIGSITKVFTSTVLASLVEEGKLTQTGSVNDYYSFAFKNNIKLNFESLASHTAALPRLPDNFKPLNTLNPYKNYGEKEIDEYLRNFINLEPNSSKKYAYSNLGAGLLGYTLGLSQKSSFQNLLQKKIFDLYGMTSSFTSAQNAGSNLVKGQGANGEIVPNWDFDVLFGGGGILSTTEDLAKFATAHFNPNNKELALTRKPTFTISDKMKIGLGWHILKSKNGGEFIWHNGGTNGYSSSMAVDVNKKKAVIILSNISGFHPEMKKIDDLCFKLLTHMSKKK